MDTLKSTKRKRTLKALRKSNKVRAKEHRERRKHYFEKLEQENKELKEKVSTLEAQLQLQTEELPDLLSNHHSVPDFLEEDEKFWDFYPEPDFMQNESPTTGMESIDSILKKIEAEEDFNSNKIPLMMRADPSSVRFSMFEAVREKIGFYGSLRLKLLKKAFRWILENILPEDKKSLILTIMNLNKRECIRKMKSSSHSYRKMCNPQQKHSKYYLLDDWENNEALINILKEKGRDFKRQTSGLKKLILDLVRVRNSILNVLKEMNDTYDDNMLYLCLDKDHHLKIAEATKRLKEQNELSIFNLWNIRKKMHDSQNYKDDELSE